MKARYRIFHSSENANYRPQVFELIEISWRDVASGRSLPSQLGVCNERTQMRIKTSECIESAVDRHRTIVVVARYSRRNALQVFDEAWKHPSVHYTKMQPDDGPIVFGKVDGLSALVSSGYGTGIFMAEIAEIPAFASEFCGHKRQKFWNTSGKRNVIFDQQDVPALLHQSSS